MCWNLPVKPSDKNRKRQSDSRLEWLAFWNMTLCVPVSPTTPNIKVHLQPIHVAGRPVCLGCLSSSLKNKPRAGWPVSSSWGTAEEGSWTWATPGPGPLLDLGPCAPTWDTWMKFPALGFVLVQPCHYGYFGNEQGDSSSFWLCHSNKSFEI